MSLEFSEKNLNDVYSITSGLSKSSDEFGFGFPFLSFKTIFYNYYIVDELDELVNSTKEEQSKHSVKKGDVFLTRTSETLDELGMSCVALRDYPNATFNGFTKRLRPKKDKVIYPLYACYYFRSPLFRKYVDSMAIMTTRASLNNNILSKLPIIFPDYQEQKKIGHLLYNLDKKIELNKKINKNLEALAKSIYRYHFIDFEPYSQDNFKSTTIGEIPENWEVQSIGDFVDDMKNGGTPKRGESDYWDDGTVPWLKTGEINNNMIIKSEEYITELGLKNSSAKLLPINSIIMALYGKGTAARVGLLKLKATTNQACCAMICNDFNKTLFLYLFLLFNQKEIENLASGSVQQNLSKDLIANLELVVPPIEIIENLPFKEIYDKIANNYFEIEYLTNLRDTLLPKLMSGEIDVSKINCDFENIAHFMIFSFKKIIGYLGLYFIRFL